MAQLPEIVQYLDTLLETARYTDSSLNGLQVDARPVRPTGTGTSSPSSPTNSATRESPATPVQRIAFAVDAGETIIQRALEAQAQLLVVHHGIFWGKEHALTGALGRKISLLMRGGLSLYTSHLPLDGHMKHGNNVGLATFFGAHKIEPFFEFNGSTIGCRGEFPAAIDIDAVYARAKELVHGTRSEKCGLPLLFHSGPRMIKTVGFLSGSGSSGLPVAASAGLDLIISGEAKHEVYHASQELRMNALFCGHYQTETFGVRSLKDVLERQFKVETLFLEDDSGV